jgi:addiction module HigA family antidote
LEEKIMRREIHHPGKILLEDYLKPMEITQYRLARTIGIPRQRINDIIAGRRGVTADTALRLSAFFGLDERFWSGLQVDYETAVTRAKLSDTLSRIRREVGREGKRKSKA